MKFILLFTSLIISTNPKKYHKYEKVINKLMKNIDKIPKNLVYPPESFLNDNKIVLPKGIDPDKIHMTISIKELKKHKIPLKPAIKICRSLGLMSVITTPLYAAVDGLVGFIPPTFQKIVRSSQFKYFLKYMLIWYLRERVIFFSTVNALRDPKGRIERYHEDIKDKAMETYEKYEQAVEDLLVTSRNVEYYWNVDKIVIMKNSHAKID